MRKIFYLLIILGLFLIAGCKQDEILPTLTESIPPEPTSTPTEEILDEPPLKPTATITLTLETTQTPISTIFGEDLRL